MTGRLMNFHIFIFERTATVRSVLIHQQTLEIYLHQNNWILHVKAKSAKIDSNQLSVK